MTDQHHTSTAWTDDNLMSLQSHILAEERHHPSATGDFSWILSGISLATKTIASKVRRARIEDVIGDAAGGPFGETDGINVQGEQQLKLDIIANEVIKACLGSRANIATLVSEEDEEPTILRSRESGGRYAVFFDPLDGSSNIDVSVGVGTIFGIVRLPEMAGVTGTDAILHERTAMTAAGYVLYGSSTVMVLTTGNGVDMFVLDQSIGAYVLVKKKIRIPASRNIYSINEAYTSHFPKGIGRYLQWAHDNNYSSRYIGSMVADVHRTLLKGGVFIYPQTNDRPDGKLRLLYEAMPMAMLMEQAGGSAVTGTDRILDLAAEDLHQRVPVILGSPDEVAHVQRCIDS